MSLTLSPVAIQLRRDTAANFTAADPVLAAGEMAFETDTQKAKIGDGATAWTALAYWPAQSGGASGAPVATETVMGTLPYSLTTSYAAVAPAVQAPLAILAPAGWSKVSAVVKIQGGATADDDVRVKLYNATLGIDVPGSEQCLGCLVAGGLGQIVIDMLVHLDAEAILQVWAVNNTAARGTIPGSVVVQPAASFLCHCETLTDSSSNSGAVTVEGAAAVSSSTVKFGAGSLYVDRSGSGVNGILLGAESALTLGTADFTLDFWVNFATIESFNSFMVMQQGGNWMQFGLNGGTLQFQTNNAMAVSGSWSPSTGVWHHVALVRHGSSFYLWVNGAQIGSTGSDSESFPAYSSGMQLFYNNGSQQPNCYVDEIRFVNGFAAWTAPFTPPAAAYSSAAVTLPASTRVGVMALGVGSGSVTCGLLPVVSGFSPTYGESVAVTITGTGLTGATSVTIGGVVCTSVVAVSDTEVTCVSPASFSNGRVVVTTPSGSAMSAAIFGATAAVGPGGISTGLVGYWKLNDGAGTIAADASGNGNTGSLEGTTPPSWTTVSGKAALTFNGNGYVDCGASSALKPTAAMSAAFWVYPTSNESYMNLLGNVDSFNANGFKVYFGDDGATRLTFAVISAGSEVHARGGSLSLNAWNHVCVTFDGSSLIIYLNGSSAATNSGGVIGAATADFSVGLGENTGVLNNASMDEVALFNRALSSTEVATIYAAG